MYKTTFLETFPYYARQLTYNLILEFAALLILSLLIIQFIRRKHHTFELTLFFQMCLWDAIMVFCSIALDILPVFWTFDDNIPGAAVFMAFILPPIVNQIFNIALLVQWLIYVEYTLHQSLDLIHRRYPVVFVIFAVATILQLISIPMLYWRPPFNTYYIYHIISVLSGIVLFLFIIASYIILFLEKKRNRIPAYIKLTPTTLCMVAGFIASLLLENSYLSDYSILPLFYALGLLFADYYMYRRLRDIDPDTGLHNARYLSTLIAYAKKKKLTGATVIHFRTPRASKKTAELLKSWEPELSKTINMGDGLFLIISEPVKDIIADRFVSLISDQLKSEGIPVETGYETDRDAPLDEMLNKYL